MNWESLGRILGVLVVVVGVAGYIISLNSRVSTLEAIKYPSIQDYNLNVDNAIVNLGKEQTEAENSVNQLRDQAILAIELRQKELLANLGNVVREDGSINVSGQCFKPRRLVSCYREVPGDYDHMTWIEFEEACRKNGYTVGAPWTFWILGQCE